MAEKVAAELVLRGTFLGFDKETWRDADKKKQSREVMVFASDSLRYAQTVRFGADRSDEVHRLYDHRTDEVVAVRVFAGDYRALVFMGPADGDVE